MERNKVLEKHKRLAKILRQGVTWAQIKMYVSTYRKYDNWTLRDIDIVYKLKNK